MDEQLLKSSGLSVGVITAIGLLYKLLQHLNNKRIHSTCNGKNIVDVVIDIHEATEEEKKPTPKPTPDLIPLAERTVSELKI